MPPRRELRRATRGAGAGRTQGRRAARDEGEASVQGDTTRARRGRPAGANPEVAGEHDNQFVRDIAAAIAASLHQTPRGGGNARTMEVVREFRRSDPPKFDGEGGDFLKANHWLAEIRKAFTILDITEDDIKIRLVTGQLVGEAGVWWDSILEARRDARRMARVTAGQPAEPDVENMTWAEFEQIFEGQYFPDSCREKLRYDFETIEQGSMSVSEYAAKFQALSRFAPELVASEERKCRRFERGLKGPIRKFVVGHRINRYLDVVECARAVEEPAEVPKSVRPWEPRQVVMGSSGSSSGSFGSQGKKRTREVSQQTSSYSSLRPTVSTGGNGNASRVPGTCFRCGQPGHIRSQCTQAGNSSSSAPQPPRNCFNCGQGGHISRNCPLRSRMQGESGSVQQPRNVQRGPSQRQIQTQSRLA